MADSEQVVWQGLELVGIIFVFQWALAGDWVRFEFASDFRVIMKTWQLNHQQC